MSLEIGIVLSILVLAFVFLSAGWLKPDITALLVLILLVVTGVIDPKQSFIGFSSFAVMAIAGLLIISQGLERTGVVKWVAKNLGKLTRKSPKRLLFINSFFPGVLSGFVNIVAAASFFIPVILRLSKKMNVSPSKILMPMAATALIGANLTLIGASHNLVVHSLLEESEGAGFGFFEFTVVGAVLLAVAIVYLFLFGDKLLGENVKLEDPKKVTKTANLIEEYGLQDRLFEVWVTESFAEEGHRISDLDLENKGMTLLEVIREEEQLLFTENDLKLKQGDLLLIKGSEGAIKDCCTKNKNLVFLGSPRSQEKFPISTAELAEAVVPPRSTAIGKTPKEMDFLGNYGLTPIAYYRDGQPFRSFTMDVKMQEGDGILFYGPRDKMRDFNPEKNLLIYFKPGEPDVSSKLKKKGPLAAAILMAVILVAALDILPIAISAIAGAVIMVLTGIVNPFKSYDAIDWKTIVLIGGMYPLGIALNQTGAADYIGSGLVESLGSFGPLAVMGGIVLLTMILTQPIHNAAVAIIMTPIAINAAQMMDSSPRGFSIAVLVAASTTFLLPYGHPAPFLVQEPGRYTPKDYIRFGLPLNVLAFIVIILIVPVFWPV